MAQLLWRKGMVVWVIVVWALGLKCRERLLWSAIIYLLEKKSASISAL